MPLLGPLPLYQHGGMLQVLIVLMRSAELGRKKTMVQYFIAKMAMATLTLDWEASLSSGSGDIVLSSDSRKGQYVATLCPSESCWYEHFSIGISAWMGDLVSQDLA